MSNSDLSTDMYDYKYGYKRTSGENVDVPFGGFPPLYVCKKTTETVEKPKREYSTHKTAISIKNIMKKRATIQ